MRIAAIDIGTNSVHMIVVQVRPDLSFEVIDREKEMVRLGAGGLGGRKLTAEAMGAACTRSRNFVCWPSRTASIYILAAATSATREAENGGEFLAAIERQTGIRPQIISGIEEARLIHLAAVYGVDVSGSTAVVVDIGGGSVEVTLGTASAVQLAKSFKLGVIRLTEKFVRTDPITGKDERRLVKHVTSELGEHLRQIVAEPGYDRVIGTSGTILSLGAVCAMEMRGSVPNDLRNLRIPAKQLHKFRKSIVQLNLQERLRIPGQDPRRADLVVAGATLFDTMLRMLGGAQRIHAVRSRAARRADHRLHPAQQATHRAGRPLSRHQTTQHDRACRAVQLLAGARHASHQARACAVRSDQARSWSRGPRARVARLRGSAA